MNEVLVTGATGFIGTHLVKCLSRRNDVKISEYKRGSAFDFSSSNPRYIFHLAGVIKPKKVEEFNNSNVKLTDEMCVALKKFNRTPTIIFTSSYQSGWDTPYGMSKQMSECVLKGWSRETGSDVVIYALQGVFGAGCKPNYSSVVTNFCYNVAHDLPLKILDGQRELELVYIDHVIQSMVSIMNEGVFGVEYRKVYPSFRITVNELAEKIKSFKSKKATESLSDFDRYLYQTYISYN